MDVTVAQQLVVAHGGGIADLVKDALLGIVGADVVVVQRVVQAQIVVKPGALIIVHVVAAEDGPVGINHLAATSAVVRADVGKVVIGDFVAFDEKVGVLCTAPIRSVASANARANPHIAVIVM